MDSLEDSMVKLKGMMDEDIKMSTNSFFDISGETEDVSKSTSTSSDITSLDNDEVNSVVQVFLSKLLDAQSREFEVKSALLKLVPLIKHNSNIAFTEDLQNYLLDQLKTAWGSRLGLVINVLRQMAVHPKMGQNLKKHQATVVQRLLKVYGDEEEWVSYCAGKFADVLVTSFDSRVIVAEIKKHASDDDLMDKGGVDVLMRLLRLRGKRVLGDGVEAFMPMLMRVYHGGNVRLSRVALRIMSSLQCAEEKDARAHFESMNSFKRKLNSNIPHPV